MSATRAIFILRLWRTRDMPAGAWYSEVEYVPSAYVTHFADLSTLFAHVQLLLAEMERGAPEQDRHMGEV